MKSLSATLQMVLTERLNLKVYDFWGKKKIYEKCFEFFMWSRNVIKVDFLLDSLYVSFSLGWNSF